VAIFTETIALNDKVSPTAKKAADTVDLLNKAILSTEKALTRASAQGNVGQYNKLTQQLENYKASLSVARAEQVALGGTTQSSTAAMVESLGAVAGAAAAVAVAGAAVAAVFGGLIVQGAKFALEMAGAKQASITLFDAFGDGQVSGTELHDAIQQLSDDIGISKDKLTPWATKLEEMGLRTIPELTAATTAAASAQALFGDRGAEAFLKVTERIQIAAETSGKLKLGVKQLGPILAVLPQIADKLGVSTRVLGEQLKKGTVDANAFGNAMQQAFIEKGAGPLARMSVQLGESWAKLKADVGDLFEDIDVTPFLVQVKDLFGVFSQAEPSGQALKFGIGKFFDDVFKVATKLVPMVKHFFLDLIIYGLKAYIAIKPIYNQFVASEVAIRIATDAFNAFKVAAGAVGIALGVIAVVGAAFVAWTGLAVIAVLEVESTIAGMVSYVASALKDFAVAAYDLGADIVHGLVDGIQSAYHYVVDAVSGLVDKVEGTFRNDLKIHSPSVVMGDLGEDAGQGVAVGITRSAPDVHAASRGLAGDTAAGYSGGKGGSAGASVDVGGVTMNYYGTGKESQSNAELTEQMVALVFERIALEMGN
jgi:hypothetical protein